MRRSLSFYLAWASCYLSVASEDLHLAASRNQVLEDRSIQSRQQPGVVAADIFLRRGYHGSVVVGNYVYIDGGAFSYTSGGDPQVQYSTTTLSIDLSTSWTNSSVIINSFSKPSGVPNLDDGSLWYSEKDNALYAGFAGAAPRFNSPKPYPLGLWSFKLDGQGGGTWSEVTAASEQISSSLTRPYQGLSAFGGGSAFTIGGYENSRSSRASVNVSDQVPTPGIVQYNMTSGTFSNSSASGYNFNGTAERGVLHYVPSFGPQGIFVILSGDISGLDTYSAGQNIQSFSKVTIYDPSTGNFYNQTTTGNIPNGRIEFCATGANSTNQTYEIFIYAGWHSNLGARALPFDEIYILTLPAFQWIKVPYPPAHPRHGHTCNTVGNRQMLVIGGVDTLQDQATDAAPTLDLATFATKDIFTQGLAIFDMTALTFTNQYDASAAAYEQSDPVKNYYAQNSREPATWGSPTLQQLFQTTHFTNATATSSSTPTGSALPSAKSSSNTGAIAGGVVGGVLGLALIAGLVFLFLRRRRRQRRGAAELPGHSPPSGPAGPVQGDYKPYMPVLSEAPDTNGAGRQNFPQEIGARQEHYEMEGRQRHELA